MRKTLESIIDNVIKIVISNNIDSIYNKIVILKKNDNYLVEKYTSKQVFHEKINFESLITYIEEISSSFK